MFSSGFVEGTTQIVATCHDASHKYYFYAGAAPSPQHRPRSLLFADLSIAARRSLSIKLFQWPGVRRSEAFR